MIAPTVEEGDHMSFEAASKSEALLGLAWLRQATRLEGYHCIGDFHGGVVDVKFPS